MLFRSLLANSLDKKVFAPAAPSHWVNSKSWERLSYDDVIDVSIGKYLLCRNSFFALVRRACAKLHNDAVLQRLYACTDDDGYEPIGVDREAVDGLVRHPFTGELVDLQMCYSEPVLDWVFRFAAVQTETADKEGRDVKLVDIANLYGYSLQSYLNFL